MRFIYGTNMLALIAAIVSCQRELANAPCPCVEGYQCCVTRNICISAGTSCPAGDGAAGGSSTADSTGANSSAGSDDTGEATLVSSDTRLVTSGPDDYWRTDGVLTEVASGTADVTVVDVALTPRPWQGFGGAFNERGWKYLSLLGASQRNTALELLFGSNGARFNMGRIPIGASDYAIDRYTLDETANDHEMTRFTMDRDMKNLIPYVKAALAVRPDIRFWASPWTPPTWMKDGPYKSVASGGTPSPFDGGTLKADAATLEAYAQYLVKFVQGYAEQGITIEAIAPQNEPSYQENYPSCRWSRDVYTTFVGQYLGPALSAANLDTSIMLGTLSDANQDGALLTTVLADAKAKSYVKMIGVQWGMLDGLTSARASDLPLWQTEHMSGNCPSRLALRRCLSVTSQGSQTPAPNDQAYAIESWNNIVDWIAAGVSSYSTWNLVLDTVGLGISTSGWNQNALLVVDTAAKKLSTTPVYYVFRHISRYVEPGAKVIATIGGSALAFKNPDGSFVTVMFNHGAANTSIVSVGGKLLSFAMPENGWATIISQ
jgi:glucosylceramidase